MFARHLACPSSSNYNIKREVTKSPIYSKHGSVFLAGYLADISISTYTILEDTFFFHGDAVVNS